MATTAEQPLWAAGPHHLATLANEQWQTVAAPFTATIRALAIDSQRGDLWVGGGDQQGALARYDGQQWHMIKAIAAPITTLAVDENGGVWVGTWDAGVYYQPAGAVTPDATWQQYETADGLASNLVHSAAVGGASVWFGTEPYLDATGYHSGISRYDLHDESWHTYTTTQGLLPTHELPGAAAAITALAVDNKGITWAGTPRSVALQATANRWVTDTVTTTPISALAATTTWVAAAQTNGDLLLLDRRVTPGQPPVAQLEPGASTRLALTDTLQLTATAADQDEAARQATAQILAWDWRSTIDGPLCTTAGICTLPAANLTPGQHTISLRVQDDEGIWSAPVTTTVQIGLPHLPVAQPQLYLPFVSRR